MSNLDVPPAGLSRREVIRGGLAASALNLAGLGITATPSLLFRDSDALEELDRFGDAPPVAEIVAIWRALPRLTEPKWYLIDATWDHALGLRTEGLNATLEQMPRLAQKVHPPHRILPADTPFWYRAAVDLPTPCAVRIGADDGAHLWVNGIRYRQSEGIFRVLPQPVKRVDMVVRVLNKAVYGGLETVAYADLAEYDRFIAQSILRERLDRTVTKLRLLLDPPAEAIYAGQQAVLAPDDRTIAAFERSMERFAAMTIAPSIRTAASDSAQIVWETDVRTTPVLHYGKARRRANCKSDGKFHIATLTGLRPHETVEYQIEGWPVECFRALPDSPSFTFTVWGDPHIGGSRFRQNVVALAREEAAFTVGVGDQVVDASRKAPWEEFFALGAPLFRSTPVFFMGGNHDYDGCFEDLIPVHHNRYARVDGKPWHSWRVGTSFFIALDPNVQFPTGIDEGSEQHRFLLAELASEACRTAKWRFLFIHQPPFSQGWTDYEGDLPIRHLLEPLIERHKIHFVVSGHTHDYERLTRRYGDHACTFLIVGGAGGGLEDGPLTPQPVMETVQRRHHYGRFDVTPERVAFTCFATDTLVLDRWEVRG